MPSLETYLEHASECAQSIVNQWGQHHRAGNASVLTEEFNIILDLACKYLEAKKHREKWEQLNQNERLKGKLDEEVAAAKTEEAERQRAFAEAYKAAEERPRPRTLKKG